MLAHRPDTAFVSITTMAPVECNVRPALRLWLLPARFVTLELMTNASITTADVRQDKFVLDSAIKTGWQNTWKYFWPYVGICTAVFLIASLPGLMSIYATWVNSSPSMVALSILMGFLGAIFQQVCAMGFINLQLRVIDGKQIQTRDLFEPFKSIMNYICAAILYVLMVGAGFICLIVPGIMLGIKFQFYGYFIVEHKMGPLEALRASSTITDGAKMDLFLFGVVQSVINSIGWMMLTIGTFPAWLITSIAAADVYRQLVRNTPNVAHLIATGSTEPLAVGTAPLSIDAPEPPHDPTVPPLDSGVPQYDPTAPDSGSDQPPPSSNFPAVP